jgi:hypothetical protein
VNVGQPPLLFNLPFGFKMKLFLPLRDHDLVGSDLLLNSLFVEGELLPLSVNLDLFLEEFLLSQLIDLN